MSYRFLTERQCGNLPTDEKGLMYPVVLSSPLVGGHNAGFLRSSVSGEEVGLSVIVVSDENDYSSVNPSNYTSCSD